MIGALIIMINDHYHVHYQFSDKILLVVLTPSLLNCEIMRRYRTTLIVVLFKYLKRPSDETVLNTFDDSLVANCEKTAINDN